MIFTILVFFIAIFHIKNINQGGKWEFIHPSINRFKEYEKMCFTHKEGSILNILERW
jgi:hypothetical protein